MTILITFAVILSLFTTWAAVTDGGERKVGNLRQALAVAAIFFSSYLALLVSMR